MSEVNLSKVEAPNYWEQIELDLAVDKKLYQAWNKETISLFSQAVWLVGLLTSTALAIITLNILFAIISNENEVLSSVLAIIVFVGIYGGVLFATYRYGDKRIKNQKAAAEAYQETLLDPFISALAHEGWTTNRQEAEDIFRNESGHIVNKDGFTYRVDGVQSYDNTTLTVLSTLIDKKGKDFKKEVEATSQFDRLVTHWEEVNGRKIADLTPEEAALVGFKLRLT